MPIEDCAVFEKADAAACNMPMCWRPQEVSLNMHIQGTNNHQGVKAMSFQFGNQPRTYTAGVNNGKFRNLSEADEQLLTILHEGKQHTSEFSQADIKLMDQKHEAGIYRAGPFGAKANFTSNVPGQGSELAPVNLGSQIIDQVNLLSNVRGNHPIINATSDPFKMPMFTGDFDVTVLPHGYSEGDVQAIIESGAPTGEFEFRHHKVVVATEVSTEFEEDTVPEAMSQLKQKIANAIAKKEEQYIFFGDSSLDTQNLIHSMDDATNEGAGEAGQSYNDQVMDAIELLGVQYNSDNEAMVIYMDANHYRPMQRRGDVVTVDKMGPKATLLTGEISRLWGVPLSVSEQVKPNTMYVVHRPSVVISQRRAITLRTFPVKGDKTYLEATVRVCMDFPHGMGAKGPVAKYTLATPTA